MPHPGSVRKTTRFRFDISVIAYCRQKSPNLGVKLWICASANCGHLYSASTDADADGCLSPAINVRWVNRPFFTLFSAQRKKEQICFTESSVEESISHLTPSRLKKQSPATTETERDRRREAPSYIVISAIILLSPELKENERNGTGRCYSFMQDLHSFFAGSFAVSNWERLSLILTHYGCGRIINRK